MNEAPILDLRVRKAVRRFGAQAGRRGQRTRPRSTAARASACCSRPAPRRRCCARSRRRCVETAKRRRGRASEPADGSPSRTAAARPRAEGQAGAAALPRRAARSTSWRRWRASRRSDLRDAASLLVGAESIVIVWGERLGHGERGAGALRGAARPGAAGRLDGGESSGLIEVPVAGRTPAACARSAACPNLGPGLADTTPGHGARRGARRRRAAAS